MPLSTGEDSLVLFMRVMLKFNICNRYRLVLANYFGCVTNCTLSKCLPTIESVSSSSRNNMSQRVQRTRVIKKSFLDRASGYCKIQSGFFVLCVVLVLTEHFVVNFKIIPRQGLCNHLTLTWISNPLRINRIKDRFILIIIIIVGAVGLEW